LGEARAEEDLLIMEVYHTIGAQFAKPDFDALKGAEVSLLLSSIPRAPKSRPRLKSRRRRKTPLEVHNCYECGGWDNTGGDCYRERCIHNRHKYGDVAGAYDLWTHG
jgi:hypothetical protein